MPLDAQSTTNLALFLLIVLSFVTLEYSRRAQGSAVEPTPFLFRGYRVYHSFASNLGSVFSVTYLLGAVLLFGAVAGWVPLLIATAAAFIASSFVTASVLRESTEVSRNAILDLMQRRMDAAAFRQLVGLYLATYFLLLVVEVAASLLLLRSAFPEAPFVAGFMMALVLIVTLAYTYRGGFRAVLASDLVQLVVMVAFFLSLAILVSYSVSPAETGAQVRAPGSVVLPALSFGLIAFSWTATGVDFITRLNFEDMSDRPARPSDKHKMVIVSLFSLGLALLFGARVGPGLVVDEALPVGAYLESLSAQFLQSGAAIAITFIVGIFCMMFTTIDTLLISSLQSWSFLQNTLEGSNGMAQTRSTLLRLMVAASAFAIALPEDSVMALGMLAAGFTTLPAVLVLAILLNGRLARAVDARPLWLAAMVMSVAAVALRDSPIAFQLSFPALTALAGIFFTAAQIVMRRRLLNDHEG